MNRVMRVAVSVVLTVMAFQVQKCLSADEDLIPPETLKQMDPDVRSGKRPRITTLHQGDIFGLRTNPKIDADFVTFDFTLASLSSVQREIVEKWIRSGANRILLVDRHILFYRSLFSPVEIAYSGPAAQTPGFGAAKQLLHPVNTDCKDIVFRRVDLALDFGAPYAFPCVSLPPEGASAVVEDESGKALCGAFPLDRGEVVFKLSTRGMDSRRWELNFWHWALGLPVPGAAETAVAGASSLTLAEASKYDGIMLKNGDTISGTILNEKFTIQTSYAELPFERAKIEKIVFEGAGANLDSVVLRVGDKMSGVVKDQTIQIRLLAGQTSEIAKDKIKAVQMRKVEGQ